MTLDRNIIALRDQGYTLREIAKQYGKSISWVYARINPDYAVSRTNKTAAEFEPTDSEIDQISEFERYRAEGLTYQQIAHLTGKSIGTVYKYLNNVKGAPQKETAFQRIAVVPYLRDLGHTNILSQFKIGFQRADIMSTMDSTVHITEVKVTTAGHAIQIAIGQLIIHKYYYPDAILQIAVPNYIKFHEIVSDHLKDFNIHILTIPFDKEEI